MQDEEEYPHEDPIHTPKDFYACLVNGLYTPDDGFPIFLNDNSEEIGDGWDVIPKQTKYIKWIAK